MGLFGGSKSSSTTNVDETNTQNIDNRVTEADKAIIGGNTSVVAGDGGGSISLTTTDLGALDAASEISDNAFEFSSQAANQLGAVTSSAIDKANRFGNEALNLASEATRDEAARTTQLLIIAGALVVGAFIIRKVIK